MMTWGFPCTDISVAGHQKGFLDEEGNKTRSGMYYEGIRILRKMKPALSIIENVKNLTGKKFKKEFEMVLSDLDEAGYNSYYKVLNAKDYGVPQNRERVFIVSIRKVLDNGKFKFPETFDNGVRLKDILEDEVHEKYYLSDDKVKRFITNLNSESSLLYDPCQVKREGKSREYNDYSPTLTSRDYKDPRLVNDNAVKQVGNIVDTGNWKNPQRGRIYSSNGCSPALNCCGGGGGLEPKIIQVGSINSSQDGIVIDPNGISKTHTAGHNNQPKIICGIDKSISGRRFIDKANYITAREDRGVSNHKQEGTAVLEVKVMKIGNVNPSGNGMNGNVFSDDGLAPTLTTNKGEGNKVAIKQATKKGFIECEIGGVADLSYPNSKTRRGRVQEDGSISPTITATETGICRIESNIRIRKLIPLECFRLMGFTDEEFFRAMIGLSYKANEFIEQHPYLIGKTILDEAETIQGISNSQLYKMSGNSIVVDVLYYIYVKIYKAMPYLFDDLRLSSFFSGIGAFESGLNRLFESIRTGNFTRPQVD